MTTLDDIAKKHGADKSSAHHGYCNVYDQYFAQLRDQPITLLEIGFGGYHYPDRGGAGAKMWAEYLPNAHVVSVDIHFKNPLHHPRIFFYQGSQTDQAFLQRIVQHHDPVEIIIDDGSHRSEDCIQSFETLFPMLKPGGIYVIEDLATSYWHDHGYGGGTHDRTTMNYFKRLTDHLNAEHNGLQAMPDIQAIHFWKQQVFILKSK